MRDGSRLVAVDHPEVAAFLAMAPHSATTVRTSGARDAQLGDHGALSTAICSAYTARHALMMILTHLNIHACFVSVKLVATKPGAL